eukprot:TCALIF_09898-PA protein Name:"Similar to WNT3A Protein Wnt-3a (Gallus gallus)" AED:0.31 eAED:0.31 QI:0/0/0/1/1/1/3/0/165
MAFVHAISSAGVAHTLTKACSAGELENCGCDRTLKGASAEGFEIGEKLIEKFDNAHEVQQNKYRGRRMLQTRSRGYKHHTDTDLVYLKSSPSYCDFEPYEGSLGTQGRECNPKSHGADGCDLMCCNRGHTTRREKRKERCRCKFRWCCFVECDECILDVDVSTCN